MDSEELQEAYGDKRKPHYLDWVCPPLTVEEQEELENHILFLLAQQNDDRNSFELVKEFMEVFGHPVYDEPREIGDEGWLTMRLELIREELCELYEACGFDPQEIREAYVPRQTAKTDLVEAADALGDLEYVVNGAAHGMGINLPAVVREVHRSNMSKAGEDGKPIWREDGKVLKGPNYFKPDIAKVLGIEE